MKHLKKIAYSKQAPKCANSKCNQSTDLFKSCHYCYTFYCSKECRQQDWPQHKSKKCYYGRLSSLCKKSVVRVGRNADLRDELSKIAFNAYQRTMQRGFIWLDFSSANEAQQFLIQPINVCRLSNFLFYFGDNLLPKYVCFTPGYKLNNINDELNRHVPSQTLNEIVMSQLFQNYFDSTNENRKSSKNKLKDDEFEEFASLCNSYDPMREFVLLVSIKANPNQLDENYEPRKNQHINKKGMFVSKFMKMSLYSKDEHSNKICGIKSSKKELTIKDDKTELSEKIDLLKIEHQQKQEQSTPVTLILTSINRNENSDEDRQLFLANLINEFDSRGIKLRDQYPKIYRDLCMYVEENRPFTPVCLFPRDVNTNNLFMCLIMPNSEAVQSHSWLFNDVNNSVDLANSNYIKQQNYPQQDEAIKVEHQQIDLDKYLCIV
jgi:hypothetical protein